MKKNKLKCPSCGWDGSSFSQHGSSFKYLEEVTSMRSVVGARKGVIKVDCDERIDSDDPGSSPRLLCASCLEEFPIPDGMKIEFS